MDGKTIAVWFSCGAASAVALKKTVELYGAENTIRAVNNPVIEEDADNLRFARDVSAWVGLPIESAVNNKFPDCSAKTVWAKRKHMGGVVKKGSSITGAPCTDELKRNARYQWENENKPDYHVLGYTADEKRRHDSFYKFESPFIIPVLIDLGLTKNDCFKIIMDAGINLPRTYTEASRFGSGYPNANCIGCIKATSPTYWNHVRETRPEVFKERAEQSRVIGRKLVRVKNQRIFLDELHPDARGRDMKTMKIDCGIICQTGESK